MSFASQNNVPFGVTINQSGDLQNWSTENKFGYNPTVGGSFETVWDGANTYTYISTPGTAVITSDDTTDDNGGTVRISGLDSDYKLAEETLTIGGSAGTVTWSRVFRAVLINANTGTTNSGTVTVTVDSVAVAKILPANGQTLMAVYTTPADSRAYLVQLDSSSAKDLEHHVKIVTREIDNGNAFNTKAYLTIRGGFSEKNFAAPLVIPPKTDIEVQCKSSATSAVAATFELFLEKRS
jgi:hypothetical protein